MRRAWVDVLLRLHPSGFRKERGGEVRDLVEREGARARAAGGLTHARFVLRTTVDLVSSAVRLRLRPTLPGAGGAGGRTSPGLIQDLGHAFRGLSRTPLVTSVVVVTLGLGVGLTTAVFTVADAVLFRPLEYRDAARLVEVTSHATTDGLARANFSGGDFRDVRDGVPALADAVALTVIRQNLTGVGLPLHIAVGWASGNLPEFLGVDAVVGRVFTPDDPPGTVLLGHDLWQERFGGDPAAVGRTLRLDGHPHTVVGVLPQDFRVHLPGLADAPALWKNPDAFWTNGDIWGSQGPGFALFRVLGRLQEGVGVEQARQQLVEVEADLRRRFPDYERAGLRLSAEPLRRALVADVRGALALLGAAALAVLLIACANVAAILLVRARGRLRELAVRRALGASRGRLVSLVLSEGLLLAGAGAAAGLALAAGLTRLLVRMAPPVPRAELVGLDQRVLAFALVLGGACTLLVGLVPAWSAARADPAAKLAGGRGDVGGRGGGLQASLVAGQLALSLVLLTATGLLTSSLLRLRAEEPGFRPEGILTFAVTLPGSRYERDEAGRFLVALEDELRSLPAVRSAGVMWPAPLGSGWQSQYHTDADTDGQPAWADYRVGTAAYFETLGIPLLDGRLIRDGDPRLSVVVSRAVAEKAWPGEPAVGRVVHANPWGGEDQAFEVVGVVADVRYSDLREPPLGALYFDVRGWAWTDWEFDLVVAAEGPPMALVPDIRDRLAAMDPEVPLADVSTLVESLQRETADERFALSLVGSFSAIAGLLALVGLYGTVSYSVSTRSREIGVRMALGAHRGGVVRLVLMGGMRLVAVGVGVGLLGSLLTGRLLRGWLYQVEPADPVTLIAVASGLAALALASTWIPAQRAASTDPVEVLRGE